MVKQCIVSHLVYVQLFTAAALPSLLSPLMLPSNA